MRMKKRRCLLLLPVALITLALVLGGCGNAKPAEEGGNGQEEVVQPGNGETDLLSEALQAMEDEGSYRITGELDFTFLVPSASLGQPVVQGAAGIPYEAEHQAEEGTRKSRMVMKMSEAAIDQSVPPALLPEVSKQETFLIDGLFYYEDPAGWQNMAYDPSEALLDMNVLGLLPEDVLNWLLYAETAEPADEMAGSVGYQVTLGNKYYQAMKEQAQKLYVGEEWNKKMTALNNLESILPSMNVYAVIDKQSKHIEEVQFAYAGMVTHLAGPLPEDSPFGDMTFYFSSTLIFSDYGAALDIQAPK